MTRTLKGLQYEIPGNTINYINIRNGNTGDGAYQRLSRNCNRSSCFEM